jgi:Helicase conserved C-terminal domain
VGYFNAVRELAGAAALYRQDIPQRLAEWLSSGRTQWRRELRMGDRLPLELSSREDSLRLPGLLQRLETSWPEAEDVVLATSMFGTGVDVLRLGMMVVNGQPKSTAAYIQATGRVGRKSGGLVIDFLRASRPRDLDHYEHFIGYHRALYRSVEPVTVAPFSPRARDRGLGPLEVVLLRHAAELAGHPVSAGSPRRPIWAEQRITGGLFSGATVMGAARTGAAEVQAVPDILETRATTQPGDRRPAEGITAQEADSWLDVWRALASDQRLQYSEVSLNRPPSNPVVLGDPAHELAGIPFAFRNAPQSLREVEATTQFQDG